MQLIGGGTIDRPDALYDGDKLKITAGGVPISLLKKKPTHLS